MFKVRVKQHLIDNYKQTGERPNYFPSPGSPMDLLLDGHEAWGKYAEYNEDNIKLIDDRPVMFRGQVCHLKGYVLTACDCILISSNKMDNREVRDV